MTSLPRTRVAVWSLLLTAALALWLLFGADRSVVTDASADARAADGLAAARLGAAEPSELLPTDLVRSRAEPSSDLATGEDGLEDQAPVHLRVLLRIYDEEGEEKIPPQCAGWVVRAQSWLTETGETFPHEARADERGVAEFVFKGFTHVDWVGCAPPLASGWGFTQISEHQDFYGGSEEEWTLILQPAGSAHGLVRTLEDRPVGDAEVHAFDPSWAGSFETWTPGFLITRTGADGGFEFPSLGAGDWMFTVAPGEHLQILPPLGEAMEGHGYAEVNAGERVDVGVLHVTGAFEQQIRVVDADGDGMAGLTFAAFALSLDSPGLRADADGVPRQDELEDESTADRMQRFLAGEDPAAWLELSDAETDEQQNAQKDWPYDGVPRQTDADGIARFPLAAGRYVVECWSSIPGMPGGTIESFEILVPGPPILFRLPVRCDAWSGAVVDDRGQPVAGATAILEWRSEDGGGGAADVETDERGVFRFTDVPLLNLCELRLAAGGHLTTSWQISLLEPPSAPFCLPRGASLLVVFHGPDDAPIATHRAQVRLRAMRTERLPPAPGSIAGEPKQSHSLSWFGTDPSSWYGNQLAHGEYELSLSLGQYSPAFIGLALIGSAMSWQSSESVLVGAWRVETGPEPVVIRLDAAQHALLFPKTRIFSGVVVDDETGVPIRGATVTSTGVDVRESARTGDDGRFAMELRAELIEFQVSAQGYEELRIGSGSAQRGDGEHELRLRRAGAMVHLRVFDRDGRQLPPCTADLLYPNATGEFPPTTLTDGLAGLHIPEGEIYLPSKTLGRHRVRLTFAPGVQAETEFDLTQAIDYQPTDCRIRLSLEELRAALRAASR